MKIFWSWQSDTPGKIGRFLIRDALQDAISELKQAPDIEEPTAQSTRDGLHLDHDVKNVTGSPDLARTILDKIDASQVVVADVTIVGETLGDKATARKKLVNSNVAIELGYAYRALGDGNVILIFNAQYGAHEDLPFDLRHKGGAVVFDLPADADRPRINEEKKKLTAQLVAKLKPYLQAAITSAMRGKFLPNLALREMVAKAASHLNLTPPWQVEFGLVSTAGVHIAGMPNNEQWGPIRKDGVLDRMILNDAAPGSLDALLLRFFGLVYDATGYARPSGLHGFPPSPPSSHSG